MTRCRGWGVGGGMDITFKFYFYFYFSVWRVIEAAAPPPTPPAFPLWGGTSYYRLWPPHPRLSHSVILCAPPPPIKVLAGGVVVP